MTTVNTPTPSPASSSSSTLRTVNGDTLFEPSVEMMVNDFDDERTLEEEEALAATEAEDPSTELSNLQRERDMPIEELLALYNCHQSSDSIAEDMSRPQSSSISENENESEEQNDGTDDKEEEEEESELHKLYPETYKIKNQKFLRSMYTISFFIIWHTQLNRRCSVQFVHLPINYSFRFALS